MKRLVVIADLHCGHRAGLTPPAYQSNARDGFMGKISQFQNELWNWYRDTIESLKPIFALVCNGDAIDGKGERSGSTELIEADRLEQIKMAEEAIRIAEAKEILIMNGTPYHTGKEEDWEAVLAGNVGGHYANHEGVNIDGVEFDFKHKVSSSIIPHGRFTGPRRAAIWDAIWADRGMKKKADYIIRSHVHYQSYSDTDGVVVITTPALQGWSKFGSRECEGTNDIGFYSFDCENGSASSVHHKFDMLPFKADSLQF